MEETASTSKTPPDESFLDTTPYGSGKDDSVTDVTENAAITHHTWAVNGMSIQYTATAGHLVTTDLYSARPSAKIFYVAFTADGSTAANRPITFFLQWWSGLVVGVPVARVVRAATNQN